MAKANESTILTRLKRDVEDLLAREDERTHFWENFWAGVGIAAVAGILLFVLGYTCYQKGHVDGYSQASHEYYDPHSMISSNCFVAGNTIVCH